MGVSSQSKIQILNVVVQFNGAVVNLKAYDSSEPSEQINLKYWHENNLDKLNVIIPFKSVNTRRREFHFSTFA